MATIKEMAEKYTKDYCHELDRDEEGGAWVDIPKLATDSYMAGANAVLEKIEEATQICFDEELLKVIRELKGE